MFLNDPLFSIENILSVENQKGIIAVLRCPVENQKGTITVDFLQQ